MLKKHVIRWTRGQVWVVVAFLGIMWFAAYKVIDTTGRPTGYFERSLDWIVVILFLGIPVAVARILFVWFGRSSTAN